MVQIILLPPPLEKGERGGFEKRGDLKMVALIQKQGG
jgi:hypothetical protein